MSGVRSFAPGPVTCLLTLLRPLNPGLGQGTGCGWWWTRPLSQGCQELAPSLGPGANLPHLVVFSPHPTHTYTPPGYCIEGRRRGRWGTGMAASSVCSFCAQPSDCYLVVGPFPREAEDWLPPGANVQTPAVSPPCSYPRPADPNRLAWPRWTLIPGKA